MTTRLPRPWAVLATLIVLLTTTVSGLLATAAPAYAHSVLMSTDPEDGATLAAPPAQVRLTFNEAVKGEFSKVLVTTPDGTQAPAATQASGPVVTAALPAGHAEGTYRVVYSVVSADTHRISGQLTFTVSPTGTPAPGSAHGSAGASPATSTSTPAPGAGSPSQPGPGIPSTSPAAGRTSSSTLWGWVLPLGAAVLAVPLVWVAHKESRRRQRQQQRETLAEDIGQAQERPGGFPDIDLWNR